MVINEQINISDDRLVDGIIPVINIMSQVNKSPDESIVMDFSQTRFISPVFALSLIVYLSCCGKRLTYQGANDYLELIGLPFGGICPDKMRKSAFLALMEGYSKKTYIPIVSFPACSENDDKEAISTVVENIIIRQQNIPQNVATGLKFMIEETLDNITEHSESDRGFIFAQAYPQKKYLDLCIADRGVTLLGSYQKLPDNEITSDLEAIKAANRGISSKNLPTAENRGFGIYTSKRMLVEGLNGQYLMISGNNFYFKRQGFDSFYGLPVGLRWNGTIVALRIPYNVSKFNYINYIE
ncbi:MAG: hypothetical protein M0P23_02930 [Bacteroidales bacterium]|jgi:anti-sigma regulatory factor (Ser/Thr protein kinase)|nr:hypothetical protein [Bacteroidales bacterium]